MSDAAKSKAKQKWAIEKPKLDNARQLRGIFFIEPDDEEFKHTTKNARRKLQLPTPAATPCKIPMKSSGEYHWIRKHETKAGRNWVQTSSISPHCNRDEFNKLIEPLQFGAQIHSDASSIKNSRCKGGSGERMGRTGDNPPAVKPAAILRKQDQICLYCRYRRIYENTIAKVCRPDITKITSRRKE